MIHVPKIQNFLYVHFQKPGELDLPWYFRNMHMQTKSLYPKAEFHLLTNVEGKFDGVLHHDPNLPTDYRAKFNAFGLIDQPVMYLDMDVFVNRPFTTHHIGNTESFRLFRWVDRKLGRDAFPASFYRHYNSGIMWLKNTTKSQREDLQKTSNEIFIGKIMDDFVLSWYCYQKNIVFETFPGVNELLYGSRMPDLQFQSMHFTGNGKWKMKFFLKEISSLKRQSR